MNPLMLNMLIQTLKAFISPEQAEEIRTKITPENVQMCIDSVSSLNTKLDLILDNQNKILGLSHDNSHSNGNGNATGIAAE